jgi:hypothetical protein
VPLARLANWRRSRHRRPENVLENRLNALIFRLRKRCRSKRRARTLSAFLKEENNE